MERLRGQDFSVRLGGGLKNLPSCEHCGRPVRVSGRDWENNEVVCPTCASETDVWLSEDEESGLR